MKDQKTPEETIYESAAYKFLREKLGSHNTPTFARIAEIMQEYAQTISEGKDREIEILDALVKKQDEYIKFLGDNINKNALYLDTHGILPTLEEIQMGRDLRDEIAALKSVH